MSDDKIREARRWFAEELRFVARVNSAKVVDAFATVPRERFVGQGRCESSAYGTCGIFGRRRSQARRPFITT